MKTLDHLYIFQNNRNNTDVFLICFDVQNRYSFENIQRKYILEIREFCPYAPFLIIGCKDDLRDSNYDSNPLVFGYLREYTHSTLTIPVDVYGVIETYIQSEYKYDLIEHEEAQQLGHTRGAHKYMACSAKKVRGIDEIFDEVCRAREIHRHSQQNKTKKCAHCTIL